MLVFAFHAYARWPEFTPFGDRFAHFPVFAYGHLGVQFFFLISGYVILMSLEASSGFWRFVGKRWLRLFPAMLVCSVLVYCTAGLLKERPQGQPNAVDLLPGVLFIDAHWLTLLLGRRVEMLEDAFWTIFVEVKFYIIFAAAYFLKGRRAALWTLFALYASWLLLHRGLGFVTTGTWLSSLASWLLHVLLSIGAEQYGWFLAGALFFLHCHHGKRRAAPYTGCTKF